MESGFLGNLYIVATPIGNLSDITLRALETLKTSDYILAEDTREANKLLNKYDISAPVIPYTDEKHTRMIGKIINNLNDGKNISLISDSGTPLISDPGFKLVAELKNKGFRIIPLPGANAVTAALSASGLPTDKFIFLGFLPKKGKRKELISRYGNLDCTLIIFESSHKIRELLKEIYEILGNRKACVANDLTKLHEKIMTGNLNNLIEKDFKEKGEFILLVAKKDF
jgi:16S rRNA (cytidine1402-2'-O)-methyltransferase